jgi:hypothetical protein
MDSMIIDGAFRGIYLGYLRYVTKCLNDIINLIAY